MLNLYDECCARIVLDEIIQFGLLRAHLRLHALKLFSQPRLLCFLELLGVFWRQADVLHLALLSDQYALLELEPLGLHLTDAPFHLDHLLQEAFHVVMLGHGAVQSVGAALPLLDDPSPRRTFTLEDSPGRWLCRTSEHHFPWTSGRAPRCSSQVYG